MRKLESFPQGFEDRRLVERFGEMLDVVRSQARTAPAGMVINAIERTLLAEGRDLLRQIAEHEIQSAADEAEKKGRAPARPVVPRVGTRAPKNAT